MLNLFQCYLTDNDCYNDGRWIKPTHIVVHDTGAKNRTIKRYVQPNVNGIGENKHNNDWNRPGLTKCVHAFIGELEDGTIATCQTLPWNKRGWHVGSGRKGSYNNNAIGFEICQDLDSEEYFEKVYKEAVELCAYLCKEYDIPVENIVCHQEAYQLGYGSNHADVTEWFPIYGKSMDTFREDVNNIMEDENMTQEKFNEMMENYIIEKSKLDSTMPELLDEAKSMGLTNGISPRAFVTREECAVMARAAALYKEGK